MGGEGDQGFGDDGQGGIRGGESAQSRDEIGFWDWRLGAAVLEGEENRGGGRLCCQLGVGEGEVLLLTSLRGPRLKGIIEGVEPSPIGLRKADSELSNQLHCPKSVEWIQRRSSLRSDDLNAVADLRYLGAGAPGPTIL